MSTEKPVVAVTGAYGYLGSRVCSTLESQGLQVVRLVRSPRRNHGSEVAYDLARPITDGLRQALGSADVLIHAAYDLSLTGAGEIWRVNVEGTRRLLEVATEAAVGRIIVMSSMSAFEGTSQLYGRAKLDIEAMTKEFGGCAIRPGLVYGEGSGGMAGALRKLTSLPIVPVVTGEAGVYTVREDDLLTAISALASAPTLAPETISIAHPSRVTLTDLLKFFAAEEGHRCRFVPVPWQLAYWPLRGGEFLRLPLPFRADSLLGLVRSAPGLSGGDQLNKLGVTLHAFPSTPVGSDASEKADR
jgi:nucleoside-diphosphate-sugar epimerase